MKRDRPWDTLELAKEAKVSGTYIRRLLSTGKLQGYKIGNSWAIPAEVGQRWLDERRAKWGKF